MAETRGNPLALLELPRGLTVTQMAGGFGLLQAGTLPGRIEQSFLTRIEALPADSRLLLLVAAAEPVGDPALVWRAAARLGVTPAAALAGGTDGLLSVDTRMTFRHPLVRSAVYRAARCGGSASSTLGAGGGQPTRRSIPIVVRGISRRPRWNPTRPSRWSSSSPPIGPRPVAGSRLRPPSCSARVELTRDPARRTDRALAAAQAGLQAGAFGTALGLLATAEAGVLDEFGRARVDLLAGGGRVCAAARQRRAAPAVARRPDTGVTRRPARP